MQLRRYWEKKMKNSKFNDEYIRGLVNGVEDSSPALPDFSNIKMRKKRVIKKRDVLFLIRTIAASIIILIGILLINNNVKKSKKILPSSIKSNEISEIRTDFVLKDENIRILWIQKKNFKIN